LINIKTPRDFVQNVFSKTSDLAQNKTLSKSCKNSQVILNALKHLDSNFERFNIKKKGKEFTFLLYKEKNSFSWENFFFSQKSSKLKISAISTF